MSVEVVQSIVRSGNKGTAVAADVTSTVIDANTQALDVTLKGAPSVFVSNFPATYPVTGTFWQTTQPVSGSVNISNFPASQAVTGTFWQATQPISGSVSVSNLPATQPISGSVSVSNFPASQAVTGTFWQSTQPVSGTFWQTTQPVSGPLTDTQLRASAVPVSGTFFQATQPVSGTVAVSNFPASQAVTGTFFQATQPISAASLPLPSGASTSAKQPALGTAGTPSTDVISIQGAANMTAVKVDASATTQPVSGTFWQATQPVSGTVTSNLGTLPTLTKGTQGATGFSTQDLKDSGRNQTNYYMTIQIVSTATDALLSLTGYKAGALVAATTTPAIVTAGKTYRITSITLTYVTIVTTPGAIRFTLRANTSGVVAIGSPVVMNWTVGEPTGIAPVAGKFNTVTIPFPEGLEFAAGTGIGISQVGLSTTGSAAAVGYGIVSITGFEY